MIEVLNGFPEKVLAFACKGNVTTSDYETVLIPAVDEALKKEGHVRLFYLIERDFSGIAAGAVWDDFKVGMGHLARWERIAVVTDVEWIRYTFRAFSFLIPGAAKVFHLEEEPQARKWIVEDMPK